MNSFNKKYSLIQTYSLVVIDIIAILVSYGLAYVLRYKTFELFGQVDVTICLLLVTFCLLYALLLDWNHFIFKRGYFDELIAIIKYVAILLVMQGFSVFLLKQSAWFSRLVFALFGVFTVLFTYIFHLIFKKYMFLYYKKSAGSEKVLLVTDSSGVNEILEDIKEDGGWSYEIIAVAFADGKVNDLPEDMKTCYVIAGMENFEKEVGQLPIDSAFLYLPDAKKSQVEELVNVFETMGVDCHYSVADIKRKSSAQSVGSFAGHMVVTYSNNSIDYRRRLIKRFVDIIGAIIGLLITILLTPFIALAIKLNSRGPIFFKQVRIGKNGRRFKMYKFRSMRVDAEEQKKKLMEQNEMKGLMFKIEKDPRITAVGRFLRKTSLDELPQFFNVLKGDMSLVGTRPPTVDEFEQYSLHYRRRLSITPGLTGMWQVSGRSDIEDFEEVVKLDLNYIDNWSLALDFKILLLTIGVVLFGKGSK